MKLEQKIRSFVSSLANLLIDEPDQINIMVLEGDKSILVEVSVKPEDLGKFLGKDGKIAESIRSIMVASSGRYNKYCRIIFLGNNDGK